MKRGAKPAKPESCPECGSRRIAAILYGLPVFTPKLEEQIETGRIGCRYSIPTPVTEEEKALFNVNQTGLEEEAVMSLRKMVECSNDTFVGFFESGLFPSSFVDGYSIAHGYTKNGIVRNLKEKGWLKVTDPVRKMVKSERQYCYEMTEKLKKWYEEQKIAQ